MGGVVILSLVLASASPVLAGVVWLSGRTRGEQVGAAAACLVAYATVLWTRPSSLVLSDTAVLAAAIGLSPLLGRGLGSVGGIITFAVTASVVDVLSFGGGLTRQIIQDYQSGGDDLLRFLAMTVPVGGRPTPLVGVVDLFIMGALFRGLVIIHGSRARASFTLLGALSLAVVTGIAIGGVAALPFLGFAAGADAWFAVRGRKGE